MGLFGGKKFDTVLLTGAFKGMGKSVAIQLSQKGANIIIFARNVGKLEAALAEIKCIAGSSSPGFIIDTPRSVLRKQMDVNYWSCVDMSQAILSEWLGKGIEKGEKHLIFTSSVVTFYPVIGYAPYAPSKAAIKRLSDSLVQECLLYRDDVKVHTVFPGIIRVLD
ncbi:3-ketodihydrosphingosine reductase gsl-3 [Lachnellula suecica]|uniref:3-ketodihydrosphingosine reductase gsl-3 n=1 Tax=Lachnellula suecica TaxID=602035 RepID=A0A8T9CDL2_9HELO|nr:3-ketodihydrosphingosine reductase gsl-3 [Lachnellula suecica]